MKVPREATRKRKRKIKYCTFQKCPRQAAGATRYKGAIGLCTKHKGNPCKGLNPDGTACGRGALRASGFCSAHKGGCRCQGFDNEGNECGNGARGGYNFCKAHGGGQRCQGFDEDGNKCCKSTQGSTLFCKAHGGGQRCQGFDEDGNKCNTGACGATKLCSRHGGNPCQYINGNGDKCGKSAQGSTGFCITHKGGRRCPNCIEWIDSRGGKKKFDGYCATCYHRLFPNTQRPGVRNYKTKEYAVLRHLEQHFPTHHIVNDRRVNGGCSKKKTGFFL